MVGQRVLTRVGALDRRTFLALAAAAGAAAVVPVAAGPRPVPPQVWTVSAWSGLVGSVLRLQDGAARLVEVLDRSTGRAARFSLLLDPLGAPLPDGLHTVLHPEHGAVLLGTTSVGRSGRLQVVVDHTAPSHQEQRHG